RLKEGGQVLDAVVDHEGRLARCEVLAIGRADQPRGGSLCRIARGIGPVERGASPFLDVDSQVLLVPSLQCGRVVRAEEDSSDSCDSLHVSLRRPSWSVLRLRRMPPSMSCQATSPTRSRFRRLTTPADTSATINVTG